MGKRRDDEAGLNQARLAGATLLTTGALTAAATLRNVEASRIERFVAASVLGQAVFSLGQRGVAWHRGRRNIYRVKVEQGHQAYYPVLRWVSESLDDSERKALKLVSFYSRGETIQGVVYDGNATATLTVDGHDVEVEVVQGKSSKTKPSPSGGLSDWENELTDGASQSIKSTISQDYIEFECQNLEARDAVVARLESIALEMTKRKKHTNYFANTWGSWRSGRSSATRPLSSVVLAAGHVELLTADLTKFLGAEELYAKLGLPWHRGYLLSGPPGTGKTSLALALAGAHSMPSYYISISSVKNDDALSELVDAVPEHAMVVLEDIDVVKATHNRTDEDSKEGVTLAGLLNVLDGAGTPPGVLFVMTTNYPEKLDSALTRSGRVDIALELGYVTNEQLGRLWTEFAGTSLGSFKDVTHAKIVPADIVGLFKNHMENPDNALKDVLDLIDAKLGELVA